MALQSLEHALVLTDDLDATRAFYCDVLGLETGVRPDLPFPGYWLYLQGVPCLHIAERSSYEARAGDLGLGRVRGPIDHLAFAAAHHDALVERLEDAGVHAVRNDVPAAGIRQLFVRDPNGVTVEINVLP